VFNHNLFSSFHLSSLEPREQLALLSLRELRRLVGAVLLLLLLLLLSVLRVLSVGVGCVAWGTGRGRWAPLRVRVGRGRTEQPRSTKETPGHHRPTAAQTAERPGRTETAAEPAAQPARSAEERVPAVATRLAGCRRGCC
jgi:hypothetical protein